MPSITDFLWWKINRSLQCFEAANAAHERYRASKPVEFGGDISPDGRMTFVVRRVEEIPSEIQIGLDEAVHHLRSVLDHLAFHFSQPKDDRQARRIYFPIYDTPRELEKSLAEKMPNAPAHILKAVREVQPYCDDPAVSAPIDHLRGRYSPLMGRLRDISNWTKHRSMILGVAALSNFEAKPLSDMTDRSMEVETFLGDLHIGKVVAAILVRGAYAKDEEIWLQPFFKYEVVFGEEMPVPLAGEHVLAVLADIGGYIQEKVMPRFMPYLPPYEGPADAIPPEFR